MPSTMDPPAARPPEPWPVRALRVWRTGGTAYLVHKALRRTPGRWARCKRGLLYRNPRHYWTLRGGDDYFREQEGHPTRLARLAWVADRIAEYAPASVLEVGCGYGKLLGLIRERTVAPLVGVDFSPSQLGRARGQLGGRPGIGLALASGARLPFADDSFDLVVTSAVILHNPPEIAEAIRREIVRVARRWAVHNEDTDVTYNRFGYDTAAWYRDRGFALADCRTIDAPGLGPAERAATQFCVAETWRP